MFQILPLIFLNSLRDKPLDIIFQRRLSNLVIVLSWLIMLPGCGVSPPTGETLAFVSVQEERRQLYITDTDGSGLREVTDALSWYSPTWSPDGQRLAFVAEEQEIPSLYVLEAANAAALPLRLTTGITVGTFDWDSTGGKIVFSAIQGVEEDIYVVFPDTLELVNLTAGNNAADEIPGWSHDETHIVFLSAAGFSNHHLCQEGCRYKVYMMESSGANRRPITAGSPVIAEYISECSPHWSPDDRYLIFNGCYLSEPGMNIYLFDSQTGQVSSLTTKETTERWSSWLSNDEILFRSLREEAYSEELYVMNLDNPIPRLFLPWDTVNINAMNWTSDHHWFVWSDAETHEILIGDMTTEQITSTETQGCSPRWSSSGDWIAFTTACLEDTEGSDIWVMKKDQSQLVNLTADILGKNEQPVWSP